MKEIISNANAPVPNGPFSQAVRIDKMVYLSAQIGVSSASGNLVKGGITAQAEQVIQNIKYVLEEVNLALPDIVKVTIMLTDIGDYDEVKNVYIKHFKEPYPIRSVFAVKSLALGASVAMEVQAYITE